MEKSNLIKEIDKLTGLRLTPIPKPVVEDVLAGWSWQSWLKSEVDDLTLTNDAGMNLAAWGLILRLWRPETSEERERLIQQLLEHNAHDDSRFREALSNIPAEDLETLEDLEVEGLLFATYVVENEEVVENPDVLLLSRDDYESARAALHTLGKGEKIARALKDYDTAIRKYNLTTDHPRLRDAWCLDPDVPYTCP